MVPRRFISIKECAEFLSLNPQTIYQKIYRGEIPFARIGRVVRVDLKKLEEQLEGKGKKS
jgi:excisionase family DNA binding protein